MNITGDARSAISQRGTATKQLVRSLVEGTIFAAVVILLFLISGQMATPRKHVEASLSSSLAEYGSKFVSDVGSVSAITVWLASELSHSVELELNKMNMTFADLRADHDALASVQAAVYPHLLFSMAATNCSGAFFFLFTSAWPDTEPDAASGLYLKFDSILSHVTIDRRIILYRGDVSIARGRGVSLHGSWEMQCTGDILDELRSCALSAGERPRSRPQPFFLSRTCELPGTWERARFWGAPVIDATSGTVIGVCGFEMSDIYFSHLYPRKDATVFALLDGESDAQISTIEIDKLPHMKMEGQISIGSGEMSRPFRLAAMMPSSVADAMTNSAAMRMLLVFFALAILSSGAIFLVRHLITRAIRTQLQQVLSRSESRAPAFVPEIDDLWEFLGSMDRAEIEDDAPSVPEAEDQIDELAEFTARLSLLTRREREVFDLYVAGRKGTEIGELLLVSYNTLKTHNRNIYSKLGVSSRKDMMKLIEMMRIRESKKG